MNRIAGLVALLVLAGCSAAPSVAAPAGPAAPAPAGTMQVRPESLLRLPLGTNVDFDSVSVAVTAAEGLDPEHGWKFRAVTCVSPDYMEVTTVAKHKWYASDEFGQRADAEDVKGFKAYGNKTVRPGDCSDGLLYFKTDGPPERIWYSSPVGMVGWLTE